MSAVGPAQFKRPRVEEDAQEEYNQMVGPQLPGPEGLTDAARVHVLEQKLQHLRAWMSQLQAMMERSNMQAAQNARRLFVGGLPADVTQEELTSFLNASILTAGAGLDSSPALASCRLQPEKNFAFIELRSAEEATNVMALDGVCLRGEIAVKIKRPSKYDAHTAMMLGPATPDPTVDLRGLIMVKQAGAGGIGGSGAEAGLPITGRYERNWNTLYVGGLPMDWGEMQVLELLRSYGEVKYLKLMLEKESGRSRGYAFCEFADDAGTEAALSQLNNYHISNRFITVNRMMEYKAAQQQQMGGMGGPMGSAVGMMGGGGSGGMMMGAQQQMGGAAAWQQQPGGQMGYPQQQQQQQHPYGSFPGMPQQNWNMGGAQQ
ncbi:hypothetical protein OEZ86_012814 [Tetradesmus obliquus]|nr:hypothetical protein OEZ86_012814 [Tetradesmus obliquus]